MIDRILVLLYYVFADALPIYFSLKLYRSSESESYSFHWHKYWVVRSILLVLEYFLESSMERIPLFYLARLGFFIFLSMFRGGEILYDYLVGPFLVKNEGQIDENLENLKGSLIVALGKFATQARRTLVKLVRDLMHQAVSDPDLNE